MIIIRIFTFYFKLLPRIKTTQLRWKDKFNTPRCELVPSVIIRWLWWDVNILIGDDDYWEQWLWIHIYHNHDYKKAKESWPWKDEKGTTTWKKYLII